MEKNDIIAVLGLWHLGMVTAVGLAELGHTVIGYDLDKKRIANLQKNIPPLFEPKLNELLEKNTANKKISFTANMEALKKARIFYLTFDTPLDARDEVNTAPLFSIITSLSKIVTHDAIIIVSSQVPVGTTDQFYSHLKSERIQIAYIPENLRLGKAFERFFHPAMIVIGTEKKQTFEKITSLFQNIETKKVWTSVKTAEMVKHAINIFLASSISYANELGNIAEKVGADFFQVAQILKLDERIGPYARVYPGLGFAGGTLARDLKILKKLAKQHGYKASLIPAVLAINEWQKKWAVKKINEIFKNKLSGKKIAILGLTYTAQTSTLRRSLAVETIKKLQQFGATVVAFDPKADKKEVAKAQITTLSSIHDLAKNADALVLMTEWPEFKTLHFKKIMTTMHTPIFLDPNNFLADQHLEKMGYRYYGVGRGEVL